MNKGMAKIELIAEWIFLIMWMPFSMIAIMCSLLKPHMFVYITLNVITILLHIGFFAYLIKNIINTKKYLKQLKTELTQNSTIPKEHKRAFAIGIIEYLLWLVILIIITEIYLFLCLFTETIDEAKNFVIAYNITFLIVNFIFHNSAFALIRLPQNKKLNILNIICLICSALAIITILARLLV